MKVLLLAGGLGTRLSEETELKPKPMVEIGGRPILWHIMKIYSEHGFNEFVVLLGYKGHLIKEYFYNYFYHNSDITVDIANNNVEIHQKAGEPWKVTLLDTGINTMTGGRIKRAQKFIGNEPFMLTYGDGVSDINIKKLLKYHKEKGCEITMTSVQPDGRFGAIEIDENNKINKFLEKPKGDGSWINGGFFVCQPSVFDYIHNDTTAVFEQDPLQKLALDGKLYTYKHNGFWKCMDTMKDKQDLNKLWESDAPWKIWENN